MGHIQKVILNQSVLHMQFSHGFPKGSNPPLPHLTFL